MNLTLIINTINLVSGLVLSVVLILKRTLVKQVLLAVTILNHTLVKQYQQLQLKVSELDEQASSYEELLTFYRKEDEELERSRGILQDAVNTLKYQEKLHQQKEKIISDLSKRQKQVISEGQNTIPEKDPRTEIFFSNRLGVRSNQRSNQNNEEPETGIDRDMSNRSNGDPDPGTNRDGDPDASSDRETNSDEDDYEILDDYEMPHIEITGDTYDWSQNQRRKEMIARLKKWRANYLLLPQEFQKEDSEAIITEIEASISELTNWETAHLPFDPNSNGYTSTTEIGAVSATQQQDTTKLGKKMRLSTDAEQRACWLCSSEEHKADACPYFPNAGRSLNEGCERCQTKTPSWLYREELVSELNPKGTSTTSSRTHVGTKQHNPNPTRCWAACINCGSNYHLTRNCTESIERGTQISPVDTCWKCGRLSHLSRDCDRFVNRDSKIPFQQQKWDELNAKQHRAARTFLNLMGNIRKDHPIESKYWEGYVREQIYEWFRGTENSPVAMQLQLWKGAAHWLTEQLPSTQFFTQTPLKHVTEATALSANHRVLSPSSTESETTALLQTPILSVDEATRIYAKELLSKLTLHKNDPVKIDMYAKELNELLRIYGSNVSQNNMHPPTNIVNNSPLKKERQTMSEALDDIMEDVAGRMDEFQDWLNSYVTTESAGEPRSTTVRPDQQADRVKLTWQEPILWLMIIIFLITSLPGISGSNVLDSYPICAPSNGALLNNPMSFAVPRTIKLRTRLSIKKLSTVLDQISLATTKLRLQWDEQPEEQNTNSPPKYRVQLVKFPQDLPHPTVYRTMDYASSLKQIRTVCRVRGLQDYSPVGEYTNDAVNEYLLNITCGSQYLVHKKFYEDCEKEAKRDGGTIWNCLHKGANAAINDPMQVVKNCGFWLNAYRRYSSIYDSQDRPVMDIKLTTNRGELLPKVNMTSYLSNLDNYPQYVAYEKYPRKLNWTVKCSGHESLPDIQRKRRDVEEQTNEVEPQSVITTTPTTTTSTEAAAVETIPDKPKHPGCNVARMDRRVYCVDVRKMEQLTEPARNAYYEVLHQVQVELQSLVNKYQSVTSSFKYLDKYTIEGQVEKEKLELRLHPVWHQLKDLLESLEWSRTQQVEMPPVDQLRQILKLVNLARTQFDEAGIRGMTTNRLSITSRISQTEGSRSAIIYLGEQYYAQVRQQIPAEENEYMAELSFKVAFKGGILERAELHPINMLGYVIKDRYILISRDHDWKMTFREDPVDRNQCSRVTTQTGHYHICHISEERMRRGNTACAERLWQQRKDGCHTLPSNQPTFFKEFCTNQPNVLFSPVSTIILQKCKSSNGKVHEFPTEVPRGRHHFNSTCRLERHGQLIYSGGTIPQGPGSITVTLDHRFEEAWRSKWTRIAIASLSVIIALIIWFKCCTKKLAAPRSCHEYIKTWVNNIFIACIPCMEIRDEFNASPQENNGEGIRLTLARRHSRGSNSTKGREEQDSSEEVDDLPVEYHTRSREMASNSSTPIVGPFRPRTMMDGRSSYGGESGQQSYTVPRTDTRTSGLKPDSRLADPKQESWLARNHYLETRPKAGSLVEDLGIATSY